MRVFITLLILIFNLQSITKADDISELTIENISVGDNLLDYAEAIGTTKDYILNKKLLFYPNSKKFGIIAIKDRGKYNTYYKVQFTIDPKDYKIYKIGGYLEISDKDDCVKKQKSIIEDLIEILPSTKKFVDNFSSHPADKTGESIANGIYLDFPSGDNVEVACYLWGKKISQERGWEDNLRVNLSSKIITDFIQNEAYE